MTQSYTQSRYFRLKAKIWLALASVLAIMWLILWFNTEKTIHLITKEREQTKEMVVPTTLDGFVDFRSEVPPITFDTITRDLRNYPDEFKDKTYFQHHEKKWTVQVMDVAEHKIILDYLDGRDDRKKFAYFRYADQNNKTRYLLTYGVMTTFQEAMGATKLIDFQLPKGVRVLPEEMKRYISMIDNYQRGVSGGKPQAKTVTLKETKVEVPAAPAQTSNPQTSEPINNQENKKTATDSQNPEQPPSTIIPKKQKTPAEQFEESKRSSLAEIQAKEAAQLAEMERRNAQTQKKAQEAIRQLSEQQAEQADTKSKATEATEEIVPSDEY